MAGQLIFSEENMINGNIFKFEQRLQTHLNRYIGEGMLLTTYFSQRENSTTVDRGTRDVDELFGKNAPIRYNKIMNFPMHSNSSTNTENSDELQVEDFDVEGEFIIEPGTLVPKPLDFFIINSIKMKALFEVKNVQYDNMRVNGFYKIHYRLHSTSQEAIDDIESRVEETDYVDLNATGSNINPIIKEEDFIKRNQITQMIGTMITSYRSIFYNERHNCFLYHDPSTGLRYFDMCGNEFMGKYSLMNFYNSSNVIVLNDKLKDSKMAFHYANSIYNWIELGAPLRLINKFHYVFADVGGYPYSSFARWSEEDIKIIHPVPILQQQGIYTSQPSFFNDVQLSSFMDTEHEPTSSEYEKLIWKFINKGTSLSINDVSLYTADALISSIRNIDIFLYTPIVIYILKKILGMN